MEVMEEILCIDQARGRRVVGLLERDLGAARLL
jgi:hypothetical protein